LSFASLVVAGWTLMSSNDHPVQGALELHMNSTILFDVEEPETLTKWMSSQRKVEVLA
jgi:hypothetical protein